jgi:DNA helicase HerA-like ATPase
MYVIGASGSGKTKFLEFPIQQDIKLGNGFSIIDPHGDLIDETIGFLAQYYDQTHDNSIFDRVVIVDPTDPKFTVAFNLLEISQALNQSNKPKSWSWCSKACGRMPGAPGWRICSAMP